MTYALWDKLCVVSTWFGDVCGSRNDFCMFFQQDPFLYFKFCSIAAITEISKRQPKRQHVETANVGSHNVKNGTAL